MSMNMMEALTKYSWCLLKLIHYKGENIVNYLWHVNDYFHNSQLQN